MLLNTTPFQTIGGGGGGGANSVLFMTGDAFVDSSPSVHTINVNGNVTVSSAKAKFGSNSYKFNTGWLTIPDHTDFTLGTNDWTIDFWINFDVITEWKRLIAFETPETVAVMHYHGASYGWCFQVGTANDYNQSVILPVINTWYHVALVRYGNTVTQYIGGVSTGNTWDATGYTMLDPASISIGLGGSGWNTEPKAHYDYIRVVNNTALWTTNFAPPGIGDY